MSAQQRAAWGVLYAGAAWALAQGVAQLGPFFDAPDWAVRWFVIAAAIGFPFWSSIAAASGAACGRRGSRRTGAARCAGTGLLVRHVGRARTAIVSLQRWVVGAPPVKSNEGMRYLRMPVFDSIRDDPRFEAVPGKMGLPYVPEGEAMPAR